MILSDLQEVASHNKVWSEIVEARLEGPDEQSGIHLGIVLEPYLKFILNGSKSVESRFSRNGCAPFGRVAPGDIVLLKRSSGPVVGLCSISDVWDYHLDSNTLEEIKDRFGKAIYPQEGFWEDRRDAAFATLMRIDSVRILPELTVPKKDRRGWVVLREHRVRELI